jgi:hypothetical protein
MRIEIFAEHTERSGHGKTVWRGKLSTVDVRRTDAFY